MPPALRLFLCTLLLARCLLLPASAGSRRAVPAMKLERGVCIDRQLRSIPPDPPMTLHRADFRLIKRMGFQFAKVLFNPAALMNGEGLDSSKLWYLDEVLGMAAAERLPVVVCIHPEPEFKRTTLGSAEAFARFERFMAELSGHIARRWNARQVAFQLMTEPFGSSADPQAWNYWDRLQRRLWQAVRRAMPAHTLILSGDMVGAIEGLFHIRAVEDENVLYSFTFYEPALFTQQGGPWLDGAMPYVQRLPYPSGPETLAELPRLLRGTPPPWQAEMKARVEQYAAENWQEAKLAGRIARAVEWRERQGGRARLWCAEFGCYQAAAAADRLRYLRDVRRLFDRHGIGWAYWSYNETFTVMTPDRTPFGPAEAQTPDRELLRALLAR